MQTPNLHSPARAQGESQAEYRARRAASKAAATTCAVRAEVGGAWKLTGTTLQLRGLGNQHKAPGSREQQRDSARRAGNGPRATYGQGLVNKWNRKRQQQQEKLGHKRDENGTYTSVGRDALGRIGLDGLPVRRMWLGGISARRGY